MIDDELAKHIHITLKGIDKNPEEIDWQFLYKLNSTFKIVYIVTEVKHSIRGNNEIFQITIDDPTLIIDKFGNSVFTTKNDVPALRQLYISTNLKSFSSVSDIANYATLATTIGLTIFPTTQTFWSYIGSIQMLYYVPLIDTDIPGNLEIHFRDYLNSSKTAIPFSNFFGYNINPFHYIDALKYNSFSERFKEYGYESASVLYNFSNQILTCAVIVLSYLIVCFFTNILPGKLYFFY